MFANEYPMQAIAPTVAALLGVPAPSSGEARPIREVVEDLHGVSRVAVLGIDALGIAIFQHWREAMPFLSGLLECRNASVRSIMTSKTPVNFGCMVTGASMQVHGAFTKEDAFRCETLFDVLRAHGKRSAGLGRDDWTGNELLGRHADLATGGAAEDDDAVESIFHDMVRTQRPEFLIIQFGLTDELFHVYGPYAPEVRTAVLAADAWLRRAVPLVCEHDYGVMVLADHGQHAVESEEGQRRGGHGSDSDEDCLVPLTWTRAPLLEGASSC